MPKALTGVLEVQLFRYFAAVFLVVLYAFLLMGHQWGLGFPLLNLALIGTLLIDSRVRTSRSLPLLLLSLAMSVFVAIHSYWFGWITSIVCVFALNVFAVQNATSNYPVTFKRLIGLPLLVLLGTFPEAIRGTFRGLVFITSWRNSLMRGKSTSTQSIIRILFITIPLALLFVVLFTAADPLFEKYLKQIFSLFAFNFEIRWDWIFHGLELLFFFGLFSSILKSRNYELSELTLFEQVLKFKKEIIVASVTCAVIIVLFLLVQLQYIFATEQILKQMGVMLSDYTRRGYAELLIISSISLTLVVILLDKFSRNSRNVAVILLIEIFLLLLSATRRVYLYQASFGLTEIRVLGFVLSIGLLAILGFLFARAFGALLKIRFATVLGVTIIGMVLLVQFLNVDYLVGVVKKPTLGYATDHAYIANLSTDAWPGWEDSLQGLEKSNICENNGNWAALGNLKDTLSRLKDEAKDDWHHLGGWNLADTQALDYLKKQEKRIDVLQTKYNNCQNSPLKP